MAKWYIVEDYDIKKHSFSISFYFSEFLTEFPVLILVKCDRKKPFTAYTENLPGTQTSHQRLVSPGFC